MRGCVSAAELVLVLAPAFCPRRNPMLVSVPLPKLEEWNRPDQCAHSR
jgi:hypothetical protein